MQLSRADKRWFRRMVREEARNAVEDLFDEAGVRTGGYDGATPVERDAWAEEGRKRLGFRVDAAQG